MEFIKQVHILNRWFALKCHKLNFKLVFPFYVETLLSLHRFQYLQPLKQPTAPRLLLRILKPQTF